MDPLRYIAVGVATGTAGWLLFAFGGRSGSDAVGVVALLLAVLLFLAAATLVLIGVIGAGVRAGRRD